MMVKSPKRRSTRIGSRAEQNRLTVLREVLRHIGV